MTCCLPQQVDVSHTLHLQQRAFKISFFHIIIIIFSSSFSSLCPLVRTLSHLSRKKKSEKVFMTNTEEQSSRGDTLCFQPTPAKTKVL